MDFQSDEGRLRKSEKSLDYRLLRVDMMPAAFNFRQDSSNWKLAFASTHFALHGVTSANDLSPLENVGTVSFFFCE